MTALGDHILVRESEERLLWALLNAQAVVAVICPSCGSVFALHACGASPRSACKDFEG